MSDRYSYLEGWTERNEDEELAWRFIAPGEKWAHFKPPLLAFWRSEKGRVLPPLLPPLLAFWGHGPANVGRTQANPQNARGVRKFSIHPEVKMVKVSPCNSFSNKLLGLECPPLLKIAPCARFSRFF